LRPTDTALGRWGMVFRLTVHVYNLQLNVDSLFCCPVLSVCRNQCRDLQNADCTSVQPLVQSLYVKRLHPDSSRSIRCLAAMKQIVKLKFSVMKTKQSSAVVEPTTKIRKVIDFSNKALYVGIDVHKTRCRLQYFWTVSFSVM
jgi:hypothetical protein